MWLGRSCQWGSSGQHLPQAVVPLPLPQAQPGCRSCQHPHTKEPIWTIWNWPFGVYKILVKKNFSSDKTDLSRDKIGKQEKRDIETMIRDKERQVCLLQQDGSLGHLNAKSYPSPVSREGTETPAWITPACGLKSDLLRDFLLVLILKYLNPGHLHIKYQTWARATWLQNFATYTCIWEGLVYFFVFFLRRPSVAFIGFSGNLTQKG